MSNPLQRFPRLNNAFVNTRHKVKHWLERRDRDVSYDATVGDPRNVLFVVVDCLRADHVSAFGHDRPTTPTLDAFDGAAFSHAVAPSPWTFPSVPSLLSGRYPHEHGGRFETEYRDLSSEQFPARPTASVPTIPELLESAGYDTAMLTAIPMAAKATGDRFQTVDMRYTPAADQVSRALDWIDGRDRWFLHLHLGDPHAPLDVPAEHRETFDVPDVEGLEDWRFREEASGEGFEAYADARRRAYDASVRGADDELARLLDAVPDDTVVVVCGDHGEAFWEHPSLERRLNDDPRGFYATDHGHSVLEEVARVPLWVDAPSLPSGTSDERVSLVDVVPTVLDALDVADAPATTGAELGAPDPSRPVLCEETAYGYDQRAVWVDDAKLVVVPGLDEAVWFDLSADPGESDPREDVPEDLRAALDSVDAGVYGEETMDVDDATRDRLSELGYLE